MKITTVLFISIFLLLFKQDDSSVITKKNIIIPPKKLVIAKLHQPPKELNEQLVKLKKELKKYETNKRRF